MYLPALPAMAQDLNAGTELIQLTISLFLFIFSLSMLVWGPLSDRYGRRPILLGGCSLYVISSIGIALAGGIGSLLAWRALQALGSGAASAMSMAIVKDVLRGGIMEKVVSLMQTGMILAPMLAPVLGGGVLLFMSWRGIFWFLALFGLLAMLGGLALTETAPAARGASLRKTFARMGVVLAHPNFRWQLLLFSAMAMPFMSFLAVSSFIYQDSFGLSAQAYSLFFAFNASVSILGPISHMYVLRHFPRFRLIGCHLAFMALGGALVILFGARGPWHFALFFALVTYCGSAMRAPATVLMLQSIEGDNGIVASLINCGGLFCGSLAMVIASLGIWPSPAFAVGAMACVVSGTCCWAWLRHGRRHGTDAR